MQQIVAIISASGWKQTEAAGHCGVAQPRINDLLRGWVSRFSLDALVNMATALGRRVHVWSWRLPEPGTAAVDPTMSL